MGPHPLRLSHRSTIPNADKTELYFQCLSDRTICLKKEKCHGGKNIKLRVTLLLCKYIDGSEKLKPLMIAARSRCFKNIWSFPFTYRSNTTAWMTQNIFHPWLQTLVVDMKNENRKISLFIDNCTAHNDIPEQSNIQVEFLPANTPSKL